MTSTSFLWIGNGQKAEKMNRFQFGDRILSPMNSMKFKHFDESTFLFNFSSFFSSSMFWIFNIFLFVNPKSIFFQRQRTTIQRSISILNFASASVFSFFSARVKQIKRRSIFSTNILRFRNRSIRHLFVDLSTFVRR